MERDDKEKSHGYKRRFAERTGDTHAGTEPRQRTVAASGVQQPAIHRESLENLPLATRDIAGKVGRRRGKRCALGAA